MTRKQAIEFLKNRHGQPMMSSDYYPAFLGYTRGYVMRYKIQDRGVFIKQILGNRVAFISWDNLSEERLSVPLENL